jgi:hypothetical protein
MPRLRSRLQYSDLRRETGQASSLQENPIRDQEAIGCSLELELESAGLITGKAAVLK